MSLSERLKGLGLDVEFLAWLEGDQDRLPQLDRIREIKDRDFAAAIRATVCLAQLFSDEKVISPQKPDQWLARYGLLQEYLYGALQSSLYYHANSTAQDLGTLEEVLETLLPRSFWEGYRKDFFHLRKQGLPADIPAAKPKPAGGVKESEQTRRMRAALAYVRRRSKTAYADLAAFWNERLGTEKYTAEGIKARLRKGHFMNRTEGAAQGSIEFWESVYRGDLRAAYPGPFPLSPKLRERYGRNGD